MREQLRAWLGTSYSPGLARLHRPHWLIMAALFVAGIALAVFKCRGSFYFYGYEFSHHALLILDGRGLGAYLNEPPLYALAMVPLVAAGCGGPMAGVVISLIAFGVSCALCFLLTWRIGRSWSAAVAASLVFLFLPLHLEFAAALNQESLYILSILVAFLAWDWWLGRVVCRQPATLRETFGVALCATVPVWIRYAGVSILGLAVALCILTATLWPERRRQALAIAALSFALFGVLLLRNHIYGGNLSGHPLGIKPPENLFTASVKVLYLTGLSWVSPVALSAYWWWKILMASVIALLLLFLAWSLRRQPRALLALSFALTQFTVIVVASSITRIDELNPRFVLPSFGFIAIALGVSWSRPAAGSDAQFWKWRTLVLGVLLYLGLQAAATVISSFHWSYLYPVRDYPKLMEIGVKFALAGMLLIFAPGIVSLFQRRSAGENGKSEGGRWLQPKDFLVPARRDGLALAAGVALICFVILPSAAATMRLPRGDSNRWSPDTIAWIRSHLPPGTTVLANRPGLQLPAVSLDYPVHLIPFINPENGDYDLAYGARQWNRADFLRFAVEHEIGCVVFFLGNHRVDPLLGYASYGEYIPRLLAPSPLPEVARVVQTADGTIVDLASAEELGEILQGLSSENPGL